MTSVSPQLSALTLARTVDRNHETLSNSLSRLSSGNKINRPADNPQGVALSEKIDAQAARNRAAATTVQNGISHLQSTDSFLSGMGNALTRLSELATRAQDPMQNSEDRALYGEEFQTLLQQLRDTVGGTTAQIGGTADVTDPMGQFNGRELFGSDSDLVLNLGVYADQTMNLAPVDLRSGPMAALISQDASGNFLVQVDDADAVTAIRAALDQVGDARALVGADQSRLSLVANTLTVESENMSAAVSRIRDTDVAAESTQLSKMNLLNESGTALLAQANESPNSVLRLLQD